MELNLKGKVVLVTGSGKGIGKEIARRFAQEGANIILNDINKEILTASVAELESYPVEVFSVLGSVANENDASRMFVEIKNRFGRIDILVNNAGVLIDKPMLEMTLEEWKFVFGNNLDSIFVATKESVRLMLEKNSPVIINAGSFGAVIPAMGYSAYNASKAAIGNLTRTMAAELNQKGIRVLGYIPGVTKTDIIKQMLEKEPKRLVEQIPLGRLAEPEEIAEFVVFLASDNAGYINGSMMEISGGKLCVQNPGRYIAE